VRFWLKELTPIEANQYGVADKSKVGFNVTCGPRVRDCSGSIRWGLQMQFLAVGRKDFAKSFEF
jgi:hypothetical protein